MNKSRNNRSFLTNKTELINKYNKIKHIKLEPKERIL